MPQENESKSYSYMENDVFKAEMDKIISYIDYIRKIKIDIESDDESIVKVKTELEKTKQQLENQTEKISKLETYKKELNELQSVKNELDNENKKYKKCISLFIWITIWTVMTVFSFCAIWLLVWAPFVCVHKLMPLLGGGIIVLLFFAGLLIAISHQIRTTLSTKNKLND